MALNQLDAQIFALDRAAEVLVQINGEVVASGFGAEANLLGVDVEFDIDQLPPVASLAMVNIPSWVERGQTVEIDAGFDGRLERIFTGFVKRRRHGVQGDVIDCAGRSSVLTRPFRSPLTPKSWTSVTAVAAIEDILDDLAFPPDTHIDAIVMNDGSDFTIGTVKTVFMDSAPASDMIRKIADVYGYRVYELRSGVLRIHTPFEAPQPTGFRTYGTQGTDEITETTLSFDDSNIDGPLLLGNVAANTRRSQGFTTAVDGNAIRASFWMRKIGAPTDSIRFVIEYDDISNPGQPLGVVWASGELFPGPVLAVGAYLRVDVTITTSMPIASGTLFHLVVDRTGALDAVNHYEVGADSTAGYADGIANVYDGAVWAAGGGDLAFEVVTVALPTMRLIDIADDEDENQVKKEAIVHGATVPGTTPATIDDPGGDELQVQITGNRHTDDNSLVEGDYELYSLVYQNDLIQTAVVADEVAQRLVDKYHRVLQSIEIEVPLDPRVGLGQTMTIEDKEPVPDVLPREVTGLDGDWWIRAYRHSLRKDAAVTSISLFGGDQSGTDSMANPQPDFYWTIERELIGNAIQAVVTFHSTSFDMDGQIVDYHWVDDYAGGVNDVQGGEDFFEVTFAYDPNVDAEVNMTLTVTDNDGNTASLTLAIDVSTDNSEVYTPVIACAGGNTCMATFDGGLSWNDIATPSGDARVAEVTHDNNVDNPMIVLFGTNNGRIYRSQDDMATLTLVADRGAANPIVGIKADKHIRARIWAVTSTGQVLRSTDRGLTFPLYADLGVQWSHRHDTEGHVGGPPYGAPEHVDPRPISGIMLSPPSVGRIWVFGGVGTDPETWVHYHDLEDRASYWVSAIADTAHGDTAALSVASSTGNAGDTVVDIVKSNDSSRDLGVQFAGRNPPFMYAGDYLPSEEAVWRDGNLLPAVDGRGVEGNKGQPRKFGMFVDNTNFYRFVETDDPPSNWWWNFSAVLPGTGANRPNDLLNLDKWKDIYLSATDEGIAKSIDFGETWDFLRPQGAPISTVWPGGAIGWNVAVEYRRPRAFDLLAIVTSNGADATVENALAARSGAAGWTDQGPLPTARVDNPHRLWHFPQIGSQVVFHLRYTSPTTAHIEDLYRSPDLGATWANVLARAGTVARAPDGTLWATWEPHAGGHGAGINQRQHDIRFSTDGGLTWTTSFTNASTSDSFWNIAIDPNNADRVMVIGSTLGATVVVAVSNDATLGAGASWSRIVPATLPGMEGAFPRQLNPKLMAGNSGRWICAHQTAAINDLAIYTSDNDGSTWTRRDLVTPAASTFGYAHLIRAGNYLLATGTMINTTAVECLRSDDNGQTWQRLARVDDMRAYAWDSRGDVLIGAIDTFPATGRIQHMQPPKTGQAWHTGLDVGLDAAMGYTNPCNIVPTGLAIQGA